MTVKRIILALLVVTSMVALAGCGCADDCEEYEEDEEFEGEEYDNVDRPTFSVSVDYNSPEPKQKT